MDMLEYCTQDEDIWLDNVIDTIKHSNDNFKPCIATLKFDKSVPFIYNLHDNIPPFNYEDINHDKIHPDDAMYESNQLTSSEFFPLVVKYLIMTLNL